MTSVISFTSIPTITEAANGNLQSIRVLRITDACMHHHVWRIELMEYNTPELDKHAELVELLEKIVDQLNTMNGQLEHYFHHQYTRDARNNYEIAEVIENLQDILK